MKTKNNLLPEEYQVLKKIIGDALDAAHALWEIPFGENSVHELEMNTIKRCMHLFDLSEEYVKRMIDFEFAHHSHITLETLNIFANGFPVESKINGHALYKDNDTVSFGTFRVRLDDYYAVHRPEFIEVFTRHGNFDQSIRPGQKSRSYIGVLVSIPTKIFVIGQPVAPGSMTLRTIRSIEFPEKEHSENNNMFMLFETDYFYQKCMVGREIKKEGPTTVLAITFNTEAKKMSDN
jgi:hypothetical protein